MSTSNAPAPAAATVAIDTGGTFTDLVAIGTDGSVRIAKSPSTPNAPLGALLDVLEKSAVPVEAIDRIVHGTTVATNAYVTTAGFEDVPFIQRINRRSEYDLHWLKPQPLVKRRNCLSVAERIDAQGEIIVALGTASMEQLGDEIEQRGDIQAIAVCLLFSYVNPAHELLLGEFLASRFTDLQVSLSHQIAPVWREYERSSTALADAYLKPLMSSYCRSVADALDRRRVDAPCSLLKSDGGTTGLARAPERPVETLLSGLAGGVIGGSHFAAAAGFEQAITLDMGGTSCDVGLVMNGDLLYTTEYEIEWGLPVAVPVIEVRTLGAGGGSIASIDKGGMLTVGPLSAGARPGPACYGAGGKDATVTDANLVLGRLNPDFFLGGELRLHVEHAAAAIDPLAQSLGLTREQTALAVIDIADENMTNAIRLLTIERGIDPRDFALVAFGGAGPLHAVAIARKLGIERVLVPPHPGLCSAFGAAIARLRVERVHTVALRGSAVSQQEVDQRFTALLEASRREIEAEGLRGAPRERLMVSMRYAQQNYEQDVEYVMPNGQRDAGAGLSGATQRFHQRHQEFFGYQFEHHPVELVHLKVSVAESAAPEPVLTFTERADGDAHPVPRQRTLAGTAAQSTQAAVYRREQLAIAAHIDGPAIIEELDSTTFVPAGVELTVDEAGNLILAVRSDAGGQRAAPPGAR